LVDNAFELNKVKRKINELPFNYFILKPD